MAPKLRYRSPIIKQTTTNKKATKRQQGTGMYFDAASPCNGQPLLLPDEQCLIEDEHAVFNFHCERLGFQIWGWGDVNRYDIHAKVYVTNYRVCQFTNHSIDIS